jgi:hypothetical protein
VIRDSLLLGFSFFVLFFLAGAAGPASFADIGLDGSFSLFFGRRGGRICAISVLGFWIFGLLDFLWLADGRPLDRRRTLPSQRTAARIPVLVTVWVGS